MAPASKKGSSGHGRSSTAHTSHARDRRSTSRHSTPVSALTESTAPPTPLTATPSQSTGNSKDSISGSVEAAPDVPDKTPYLETLTSSLVSADPSIEALIAGTTAGAKPANGDPPSSKELHGLHDKIRDMMSQNMERRGDACDRSMRRLVQLRKDRVQAEQEQIMAREDATRARKAKQQQEKEREREREREQERERELEAEQAELKKSKKLSKKRSRDEMEIDSEIKQEEIEEGHARRGSSVPSVGAHGLARQDGVGVNQGESSTRCCVNMHERRCQVTTFADLFQVSKHLHHRPSRKAQPP